MWSPASSPALPRLTHASCQLAISRMRTIGLWQTRSRPLGCMVRRRTSAAPDHEEERLTLAMLATLVVGGVFAIAGALAERLASVWPADEAQGRSFGPRTVILAVVSGLAAAAIFARSELPWWATGVYLVLLALLLVLTATDLEQRPIGRAHV